MVAPEPFIVIPPVPDSVPAPAILPLHVIRFPPSASVPVSVSVVPTCKALPSVLVPAGIVSGVGKTATPDYPLGATFAGRAWSEAKLLRIAYAFEQLTLARRMPPGLGCIAP